MQKITVGTTEVNVTNCYAYRYQNGKLVLKITVPQTEIEHDVLKDLLKNNTGDIVFTKADNATETFSGFSYTLSILDKDDKYEVEIECISETERKVGDLQNTVSEQATMIASQTEENQILIGCIMEMSELLYATAITEDTVGAEQINEEMEVK